jgi:Uma2 family endonuclease
MTTAIRTDRLTFAEYLQYFNDSELESDIKYELVDGELIQMALPTGRHGSIAKLLERVFETEIERITQPWIGLQGIVGVRCPRGIGRHTSRIPDVVVMLRAEWLSLQEREAVIDFDLSPPLLVVEVVSPSTQSTDYRAKRTEYAARDIPEYWIVDRLEQKVSILILSDGWYDVSEFENSDRLVSPTFPELSITPLQVFSA